MIDILPFKALSLNIFTLGENVFHDFLQDFTITERHSSNSNNLLCCMNASRK